MKGAIERRSSNKSEGGMKVYKRKSRGLYEGLQEKVKGKGLETCDDQVKMMVTRRIMMMT